MHEFFRQGWTRFSLDSALIDWVQAAAPIAMEVFRDPALRDQWMRCGGTWFAGVNALPNDQRGGVPDRGVPPLTGAAVDFVKDHLGFQDFAWDRAQVSVCLPGYPQPWDGESEQAFRFRRDRDAAHLDGLLRDANRRRSPGEQHGFILGIPLNPVATDAAPMVVYEGSHDIVRKALTERLAGIPAEAWAKEDVTEAYVQARRVVFAECNRLAITAKPGEAYLVHRLAIHGVAPWTAAPNGERVIAYFRPNPLPDDLPSWWLDLP